MTLTETFSKHTTQEFPPKYVFCYNDGEAKTILTSEIDQYEPMYKFANNVDDVNAWGANLSESHQLPNLV